MLIATVASLTNQNLAINYGDLMDSFAAWFFDSMFTPHGEVFDVGNTTAAALRNYRSGIDPTRCGGAGLRDNGNGSLMRILPLAYIECTDEEINLVSALTHSHDISQMACRIYVHVLRKILHIRRTHSLSGIKQWQEPPRKDRITVRSLASLKDRRQEAQGYVMEAAFERLLQLLHTRLMRSITSYVVDTLRQQFGAL